MKMNFEMVPHHFTGHISIQDEYNASRFESDALYLLGKLFRTHNVVIMTGGSGLYLNAVSHGIDDLPDPDITVREELKQIYATEGIQSLRSRLRLLDSRYYEEADIANPKRLLRALEVCITTGVPYSELRKKKPKPRNFECIWVGLHKRPGRIKPSDQ
jgi:tRNA dimethylallyltransferase